MLGVLEENQLSVSAFSHRLPIVMHMRLYYFNSRNAYVRGTQCDLINSTISNKLVRISSDKAYIFPC